MPKEGRKEGTPKWRKVGEKVIARSGVTRQVDSRISNSSNRGRTLFGGRGWWKTVVVGRGFTRKAMAIFTGSEAEGNFTLWRRKVVGIGESTGTDEATASGGGQGSEMEESFSYVHIPKISEKEQSPLHVKPLPKQRRAVILVKSAETLVYGSETHGNEEEKCGR